MQSPFDDDGNESAREEADAGNNRLGYARNAAVDGVDEVQQAGGRRKVRQAGKASGSMSEHGTRGLLEGR